MKEQLTYGVFALFAIVVLVDLYGRATHKFELVLMPELSEALRCVLVCWFGKGVYTAATKWIDQKINKAIEEIGDPKQEETE